MDCNCDQENSERLVRLETMMKGAREDMKELKSGLSMHMKLSAAEHEDFSRGILGLKSRFAIYERTAAVLLFLTGVFGHWILKGLRIVLSTQP